MQTPRAKTSGKLITLGFEKGTSLHHGGGTLLGFEQILLQSLRINEVFSRVIVSKTIL